MRRGDIYLAQFPFGDTPRMKLRPVLLLTGPIGSFPEVLVAYISSVLPAQPLSSDIFLDPSKPEFRSTRLIRRNPPFACTNWQPFIVRAWLVPWEPSTRPVRRS